MHRDELTELQCIAHLANVKSILKNGILSHVRAEKLTGGSHTSVAAEEIQRIRANKSVPNARPLHEYANLYICARNPMLARIIYAKWAPAEELCVLRISTDALDIGGTVVADGNAASAYTGFWASPEGLAHVDRDLTFAESWKHPGDEIEEWRHKRAQCAEVLVPDRVPPRFITGAWVVDAATKLSFDAQHGPLTSQVDGHLFFR